MSRQNHPKHVPPSVIDTLIGADMQVRGHISCTGVIHVQGEILGNVACDGSADGWLVVDGTGRVDGTVAASHVVVRGNIEGPVRSAHSVEVHPGASVVGDLAYRELSIHGGGVVNGALTPLGAANVGRDDPHPPAALAQAAGVIPKSNASCPRPSPLAKHKTILAAAALVAVVAVGWWARTPQHAAAPDNRPELKADVEAKDTAAPTVSANDNRPPNAKSTPVAADSPPAPPAAPAPSAAPAQADAPPTDVVAVRGANPNRPSNVFLLVSNGAAVLYRKKQGDSGNGARVAISSSERISVSVARDELIRVTDGADVTIFYQGQKVPAQYIESGAWIKFVPR